MADLNSTIVELKKQLGKLVDMTDPEADPQLYALACSVESLAQNVIDRCIGLGVEASMSYEAFRRSENGLACVRARLDPMARLAYDRLLEIERLRGTVDRLSAPQRRAA